jgi:protein-S-isoprenylcysteine O-methyltransferase Ste14
LKLPAHIKALLLPFTVAGATPAIILLLTSETSLGWGLASPYVYIIIVAGMIVIASGLRLLAYTIKLFFVIGKGTLAPWSPPRKLVVLGPYRYVRNPMILGVLIVIVGEAILFGSLWLAGYFALGFVANHFYFIYSEEPGLVKRFGKDYLDYKKNVPRWIPRLKPWIS